MEARIIVHSNPEPAARTGLVRALICAAVACALAACAATGDQSRSQPATATPELNPVDRPDPFSIVEEATRDLVSAPEPVRQEPGPRHLWDRVIRRFGFARCPAGSRAEDWAQWYASRNDYMQRVLDRARPWLHDIANELERRELPGELALLPIVESAYDPFAYSHGRAAGAWQFLAPTARERGIFINDFYDGRRDVWAATRAALDYLEYLNGKFGDWNLALAAYNGGQGRVDRAIERNRRSGQPTDWDSLSLPRETLGYIPKLNGLGCLFGQPERFGFDVPVWDDRPQFARVELDHAIDVVTLSARADIDIATLVALNPGLNGHLTPPGGPHHLLVPATRADRVREILPELRAEDMIVWKSVTVRPGDTLSHLARRHDTSVKALREANGLESDFVRAGQTLRLARPGATPEDSPLAQRYARLESLQQRLLPRRRFQHQVRPGESLWVIAQRYEVTVSDLRRWNGLGSSSLIRPGERIVVDLDRQGPAGRFRYTVRSGDSLWTIARRHGVSVRDLMQWNGLREGSILRPGQELVIRGGGNA